MHIDPLVKAADMDDTVKKAEAANVIIEELRRIAWAAIICASVSIVLNIVMVIVMWKELS